MTAYVDEYATSQWTERDLEAAKKRRDWPAIAQAQRVGHLDQILKAGDYAVPAPTEANRA